MKYLVITGAVIVLSLVGCAPTVSLIPPDPDRLGLVAKDGGTHRPVARRTQPMRIRPKASWDSGSPNIALIKYMGKITCMTIHHEGTQTANNELSLDGVVKRLRVTRKVHMSKDFGWGDIGYHFCIDRAGRIWEARSLRFQGAHAGNNQANKGNIGIELMGNFDKQIVNDAQKKSLSWLVKKLMKKYQIPLGEILTHREIRKKFNLSKTQCPGNDLQLYMNKLRKDLKR